MNREIAERWVAALRSGKFKQARHRLHKVDAGGDTYCCLGVLCELAVDDGVIYRAFREGDQFVYEHATATLPTSVKVWAGLQSNDPAIAPGRELSYLNDNGKGFPAIADLVETHVDAL